MALSPTKVRPLVAAKPGPIEKRTLAVSLAEEQLLLRLRSTARKSMYVLIVGGDGEIKMCEELAALLDVPQILGVDKR